jgi:hypothetical protein
MHGSVPRASATENQRRSAVEYVFLVESCTVHVYSAWPKFKCYVRYDSCGRGPCVTRGLD